MGGGGGGGVMARFYFVFLLINVFHRGFYNYAIQKIPSGCVCEGGGGGGGEFFSHQNI